MAYLELLTGAVTCPVTDTAARVLSWAPRGAPAAESARPGRRCSPVRLASSRLRPAPEPAALSGDWGTPRARTPMVTADSESPCS